MGGDLRRFVPSRNGPWDEFVHARLCATRRVVLRIVSCVARHLCHNTASAPEGAAQIFHANAVSRFWNGIDATNMLTRLDRQKQKEQANNKVQHVTDLHLLHKRIEGSLIERDRSIRVGNHKRGHWIHQTNNDTHEKQRNRENQHELEGRKTLLVDWITQHGQLHSVHDLAQSKWAAPIRQAAERMATSVNETIAQTVTPTPSRNVVRVMQSLVHNAHRERSILHLNVNFAKDLGLEYLSHLHSFLGLQLEVSKAKEDSVGKDRRFSESCIIGMVRRWMMADTKLISNSVDTSYPSIFQFHALLTTKTTA
jgi:hypothetical protein